MTRALGLLAPCLLLCCSGGLLPTRASQYDPHPPGASPSSFEGWYIRLVTPQPQNASAVEASNAAANSASAAARPPPPPASLVLIVGAMPHAAPPNPTYMASLAVHSSELGSPRPKVYTRHGLRLSITGAGGRPATADPTTASPPDFRLASDDGSLLVHMAGERCQMHAHLDGASLIARCVGPPLPWSPDGWGPEGPAAALPASLTGLHWYVHSLATPMRYSLVQGGAAAVHGAAAAHMEKNWGRSFPSVWYWAQGVQLEGSQRGGDGGSAMPAARAAFALAGGKPPAPLVPQRLVPPMWLLGVRTASRSWDFHPWDSVFWVQPRPCGEEASLLLTAFQPLTRRGVEVQIAAKGHSFAEMECPTPQGFRAFSDESFAALATVRLHEYGLSFRGSSWVQKRLVEAFEVAGAAVEFGGSARCPAPHGAGLQAAAHGQDGLQLLSAAM